MKNLYNKKFLDLSLEFMLRTTFHSEIFSFSKPCLILNKSWNFFVVFFHIACQICCSDPPDAELAFTAPKQIALAPASSAEEFLERPCLKLYAYFLRTRKNLLLNYSATSFYLCFKDTLRLKSL